jgi:methyl coenzyme M reductase subunit D
LNQEEVDAVKRICEDIFGVSWIEQFGYDVKYNEDTDEVDYIDLGEEVER